jgi:hypothetical protein
MTYDKTGNKMDDMDKKLFDALYVFQHQYPNVTSGDLQTFIMGWRAAVSEIEAHMETGLMGENDRTVECKKSF